MATGLTLVGVAAMERAGAVKLEQYPSASSGSPHRGQASQARSASGQSPRHVRHTGQPRQMIASISRSTHIYGTNPTRKCPRNRQLSGTWSFGEAFTRGAFRLAGFFGRHTARFVTPGPTVAPLAVRWHR